jgi:eukaryotic-like serine/threonine-protein kinase
MKPGKTPYLFLLFTCSCCVLASACSTSTPGSTATPAPRGQVPVATSTASPSTQTSCPAAGTARPAVMSSMASGSHQNIVYLSERGGTQTVPSQATLMRYDMTTGSKSTILTLTHPDMGITGVQISADGQWILFVALALSENQARLQLVRTDGQGLQTLFCASMNEIGSIQWSPDSQHVAFTALASGGQDTAIYVLDLATARLEQVVLGNYAPQSWLDNTRLYITQGQHYLNISLGSLQNLYLLDTSKGGNQQPGSLTRVASANAICGSFEQSSDGTQVFSSSCTPVEPDNCRGYALQGPSTLSALPAAGGTARTIYSSQSHAVAALHPVSSQTLLMYIENTGGDFSQNGLWKINTDGSGLTRLTTAAGQRCADREYAVEWPQIISNGQSYALRANESLMVGSLNGGAPRTFESMSISEGILNLVGMVMM